MFRALKRLTARCVTASVLLFSSTPAISQVPVDQFVNFESAHVHPLEMTPDGLTLLAVNTANNTLEVFDINGDGTLQPSNSIPVGHDPISVRARTNNEVWVANLISDSISIVDLSAGSVVRTLQTQNEPSDIVFAGDQRAFVSCAERESIQVFNLNNLDASPSEILLIGEQPRALAVSNDGNTVYAAFFESGNQTTVVPGNDFIANGGLFAPFSGTTIVGNDVRNLAGPYGGAVPVPNDGNDFNPPLNPALPAKTDTQSLVVKKQPDGRWLDDNNGDWTSMVSGGNGVRSFGWDLQDRDVALIDANSLNVSYQNTLGNILMAMSVNPASGDVYVVGTDAMNHIRFEPNLNGTFMRHQVSRFTPGNSAVTITDLNPHLDYQSPSVSNSLKALSVGDPRAVKWESDGDVAWVSSMGTNTVIKIDANGARVGDPIAVGEGPTGIVLHEPSNTAFILNKFSSSISSVDLGSDEQSSEILFFDPTPQVIRDGRKHLYNTFTGSGNGTISCASCHVDGKWDRLAWDLGDPSGEMETTSDGRVMHPLKGLKTTQTLIDIISSGLPLHWRGDRDSFRDFHLAFENLKGREPISESAMVEFEDFIATTYHPPNPYRPAVDNNSLLTMVRGPGTSFHDFGLNSGSDAAIGFWHEACGGCHQNNSGKGPPGAFNLRDSQYPNQENIAADLRMFYRKNGFFHNSNESTAGFGLFSDGIGRTQEVPRTGYWFDYHGILFGYAGGGPRENSFGGPEQPPHSSQNSHYQTGRQVTINGTIGSIDEAENLRRLSNSSNNFRTLRQPELGLVVHGIYQGERRGFVHTGSTNYQSDREGEVVSHLQLITAAQANNNEPLTWTLVHSHVANRLGVDRDANGQLNLNDIDDADNDGVADELDMFPDDPSESRDSDNDGSGNNADTDDDNDGVPDTEDALPLNPNESVDTDADGIGNNADTDDDGDGVSDVDDAFPLDFNESTDTDGDGVGDNADNDADNDGIPTQFEASGSEFEFNSDNFRSGRNNGTETSVISLASVGARIGQTARLFNITAEGDLDHPSLEGFQLNINGGDVSTSVLRTGSQVCGRFRPVFPNIDITVSVIDIGGGEPGIRIDATGLADTDSDCRGPRYNFQLQGALFLVTDVDNDGVLNERDLDSDNDSIPDVVEAGLADVDNDFRIDDQSLQGSITTLRDSDGDGIPDMFDRESNNARNDGTAFDIANTPYAALDTNRDGTVNSADINGGVDVNGNGVDDQFESIDPIDPPEINPPSPALPVDNPATSIVVDGSFSDWNSVESFPVDPDDVSGTNNVLDIRTAAFAHDSTNLYVRMETYDPLQLTWGLSMQIDTDGDINTGFRGFGGEFPIGIDYMLEANTVHQYTGRGLDFTWDNGTVVQYAISGNSIELALPLTLVGNPDSLRVFFFANNIAVNGDARDYAPDTVTNEALAQAARHFVYTLGAVDPVEPVDPEPVDPEPVDPPEGISNEAAIVADGDLSDWSGLTSFGADPDDVSGENNRLDWREGFIAHDDDNLYLGWRNDGAAELSWGNGVYIDADQNLATGFRGFSSELPIGVEYLYEANILHVYTGSGTDWSWDTAGTITPAIEGNAIEAVIPRSVISSTAFDVFFYANNVATGGAARDFYPDAAGDLGAAIENRRFRYNTESNSPENPENPENPEPEPVNVIVDGDLADWPQNSSLGSDDPNDMTPPDTIDWKTLWATADAQNVYIAYESYDPVSLSWGYGVLFDTDNNAGTGFRGFANELPIGVDYILEANELNQYTGLSQNEWSWESQGLQTIAFSGNVAEVSIPRSVLGDPSGTIQLLLKGENVAVGGNGTDLHPDTESLAFALSSLQNDDVEIAQSEVSEPDSAAAKPAQAIGEIGGGGAMGWQGLLLLAPFTLWCKALGRRSARRRRSVLKVTSVLTSVVLIAACSDGVELDGGGGTTGQVPNNNPSFVSIPSPSAPSSNASFNLQIAAALSDDAANSAATGSANVTLNRHTGALQGSIRHSVADATHAVVYHSGTGEGIVLLGKAEPNLFRIPAGTRLNDQQITAFEQGELSVRIHSQAYPKGEIQALLSDL